MAEPNPPPSLSGVQIGLDAGFHIISVTDGFLRLLQKRRDEVLGHSVFELASWSGVDLSQAQESLLQAQKLEAIGRLAGGIAHDFNNLLTGILGITEDILQGLPPDDERRDDLTEVIKASRRAHELTKQLLAFGRRQVSAPAVLNLNRVITEMNRLFARLLGADVHLNLGLDPRLGSVKIDQSQLEQILVNLLLNARDAMKHGGRIALETSNIELGEDYARRHAEVQPGSYVLLSITDDGEGMDAGTMEHIFEPFFSTKERGKGTGLGLSTVYGIVKQNGGDITVSSRRGLGTTFRIFLPRVRADSEPAAAQEPKALRPGGTETLLVVDDEEIVRHVTTRTLRTCGYSVFEAAGAFDALAIAQAYEGSIDLLITDVVMPSMDGRELAEALRKGRPELNVLFMSGYPQDVLSESHALPEPLYFLEKTFTSDALCQRVRQVLDSPR